jgi:flavin-binding protein dodecin
MGAGLTYEGGANDRVRELDWFEVESTNGDLESGPCATNASF